MATLRGVTISNCAAIRGRSRTGSSKGGGIYLEDAKAVAYLSEGSSVDDNDAHEGRMAYMQGGWLTHPTAYCVHTTQLRCACTLVDVHLEAVMAVCGDACGHALASLTGHAHFKGGRLIYALPAPPARYVVGSLCKVTRQAVLLRTRACVPS